MLYANASDPYLQNQSATCNCLGVASASNNSVGNGINLVKFDFGTVSSGSVGCSAKECGYFEVEIK